MKKVGLFVAAVVIVAIIGVAVLGCTAQQRAFSMGGSATVDLPKGQKLVNITWKTNHLWYLTRPMTPEDKVETYSFQESSSFGILQGVVTVSEHHR